MTYRHYLLLFILGAVFYLFAALLQPVPGYMDAEYYYAGGLRIYNGQGLTEPFLWNFLDDPVGIPHPSFTYWMPLSSLLAAAGMLIFRSSSFLAARFIFVLIAGLIGPITAHLGYSITGQKNQALLSGLLAIFSGFFAIYLTNTETFLPYMVFGTLFIYVAFCRYIDGIKGFLYCYFLGLLSGLLHLTRADGVLWLFIAIFIILARWIGKTRTRNNKISLHLLFDLIWILFFILAGYLTIMILWYVRNIELYGQILSPAGGRVLWSIEYNDLYLFPASQISLTRWLSVGWGTHLNAWLEALWTNIKTAIAVQGEIFLFPLIITGFWVLRGDQRVKLGAGIWLLTIFIMSIIFPFAGPRGGFLHSGVALQPLLWAIAPSGLERLIAWAGNYRKWFLPSAQKVFSSGVLILSILFTLGLYWGRVIGADVRQPIWRESYDDYVETAITLNQVGASSGDIVLVNNPPGFYVATGRSSIAIPKGDETTQLDVAKYFGAKYLILEKNTVPDLVPLYQKPEDKPGLKYLKSTKTVHIFKILQ